MAVSNSAVVVSKQVCYEPENVLLYLKIVNFNILIRVRISMNNSICK